MKRILSVVMIAAFMVTSTAPVYGGEFADLSSKENLEESIEGELLVEEYSVEETLIEEDFAEDVLISENLNEDFLIEEAVTEETLTDETLEDEAQNELAFCEEADDQDTETLLEAYEGENEPAPEFNYSNIVFGFIISIHADEGVLPEGTSVKIRKETSSREQEVKELINDELEEMQEIEKLATFDITFRNSIGEEIQPENGTVDVSFEVNSDFEKAALNESSEIKVYHIDDNDNVEEVSAEVENNTVIVEAESFSDYAITIINENEQDFDAPIFHSISVTESEDFSVTNNNTKNAVVTVTKSGKSIPITFTTEIYDNYAGVDQAYIRLNNKNGDELFFWFGFDHIADAAVEPYDRPLETWKSTVKITSDTPEGTYTVSQARTADIVENVGRYPDEFKNFKVIVKPATNIFEDVNISKISLSSGLIEENTLTLERGSSENVNVEIAVVSLQGGNVTEMQDLTSIQNASVEFARQKYSDTVLVSLKPEGNRLKGKLPINATEDYEGTWYAKKVTINAKDGRTVTIARDKFKGTAQDRPNLDVKVVGEDTIAPEITGFDMDMDVVELDSPYKDKKINFTFYVKDNEGGSKVKEVFGYLVDPLTSKYIYLEGHRQDDTTFTGSVTLKGNLESGLYYGSRFIVRDNALNERGYSVFAECPDYLGDIRIKIENNYTYDVHFDGNNGTGDMEDLLECAFNKTYVLPANGYKRAGYTYNGWNTERDGSGEAVANKAAIRNFAASAGDVVTLYAQWKPIEYKITYKLNGGTGNSGNPLTYNGDSGDIVLKAPIRTGYRFDGWYSESKFKNNVTVITSGSLGNKVLYAKWLLNKYDVTFDANTDTETVKATGAMSDLLNRSCNKSYKLPSNKYKRLGYTFVGWNTDPNATTAQFKNKAKIKNLSLENGAEVKLYAVWSENKYKITYYMNSGTNSVENPTRYTVNSPEIVLQNPVRAYSTFGGWYLDKSFKKPFTSIPELSTGNKKVYAKFIWNNYSVTFDSNAGGDAVTGQMAGKNYRCGKKYSLPSNKFKRAGYKFLGWSKSPDAQTATYKNKGKVINLTETNNGNVVLYAIWAPK